jgi:hypothetical protein
MVSDYLAIYEELVSGESSCRMVGFAKDELQSLVPKDVS